MSEYTKEFMAKHIARFLVKAALDGLNEALAYRTGEVEDWQLDDAARMRSKADVIKCYLEEIGADPEDIQSLKGEITWFDCCFDPREKPFKPGQGQRPCWWKDRMERIFAECRKWEPKT